MGVGMGWPHNMTNLVKVKVDESPEATVAAYSGIEQLVRHAADSSKETPAQPQQAQ